MGDLNAKAAEWGSPGENHRGGTVMEWVAALDLVVHNDGLSPTCIRQNGSSFVDVTITTVNISRRILDWRVCDEETYSDHQYIRFEVSGVKSTRRQEKKIFYLDKKACGDFIGKRLEEGNLEEEPGNCENLLKEAHKRASSKRGKPYQKAPYWWNGEIEGTRKECISARRVWGRSKKRTGQRDAEREEAEQVYREKKEEPKERNKQI